MVLVSYASAGNAYSGTVSTRRGRVLYALCTITPALSDTFFQLATDFRDAAMSTEYPHEIYARSLMIRYKQKNAYSRV